MGGVSLVMSETTSISSQSHWMAGWLAGWDRGTSRTGDQTWDFFDSKLFKQFQHIKKFSILPLKPISRQKESCHPGPCPVVMIYHFDWKKKKFTTRRLRLPTTINFLLWYTMILSLRNITRFAREWFST